ncbi:MAG: hypothetical protein R3B48_25590 [Kofleriaceae bacterium]
MKLLFATFSLVCLLGWTSMQSNVETASSEPQAAPQAAVFDQEPSEGVTCPFQWYCDDGSYYTLRAACLANCSGPCIRDANCSGNCVCP